VKVLSWCNHFKHIVQCVCNYIYVKYFTLSPPDGMFILTLVYQLALLQITLHGVNKRVYKKFPDWPPGAKTVNGIALCH